MKIIRDFPPNYDQIAAVFDIRGRRGIVFTYGDTIYAPHSSRALPEHLKIHERTHIRQQGNDPAGWWKEYINNASFRLGQEVAAYRRQYKFFINHNHNIKEQKQFLESITKDLSSEMYGNVISQEGARALILGY